MQTLLIQELLAHISISLEGILMGKKRLKNSENPRFRPGGAAKTPLKRQKRLFSGAKSG